MDAQRNFEAGSTPTTWQDYVHGKITPLLHQEERIEFISGLLSKPRTLSIILSIAAVLAIIAVCALLALLPRSTSEVLLKAAPIFFLPVWIAALVMLAVATKAYFLAITDERLILIETKRSFLTNRHQWRDLGIVQLPRSDIQHVKIKRDGTLTLSLAGGNRKSFQIRPPLSKNALTVAHDERWAEIESHLRRIGELLGS